MSTTPYPEALQQEHRELARAHHERVERERAARMAAKTVAPAQPPAAVAMPAPRPAPPPKALPTSAELQAQIAKERELLARIKATAPLRLERRRELLEATGAGRAILADEDRAAQAAGRPTMSARRRALLAMTGAGRLVLGEGK